MGEAAGRVHPLPAPAKAPGGAAAPIAQKPTGNLTVAAPTAQKPTGDLTHAWLPARTWCFAVYAVPWLPDTCHGVTHERQGIGCTREQVCFSLCQLKPIRHKTPPNGTPVPSSPCPTRAQVRSWKNPAGAGLLEAAGNTTYIHTMYIHTTCIHTTCIHAPPTAAEGTRAAPA